MNRKKPFCTLLRACCAYVAAIGLFSAFDWIGGWIFSMEPIGMENVWAEDRANSEVVPGSVAPATFSVQSDGQVYKVGQNPALTAKVNVRAQAGGIHRIKSVEAWLWITNMDRPRGKNFTGRGHGYVKGYKVGKPKSIDSTVSLSIPQTELAYWLTDQCNALAREKRTAGLGNRVIFNEDHTLRLKVYSGHKVSFTGGFQSPAILPPVPASSNLTLICRQGGQPQVPTAGALQARPKVEKVDSVQLFLQPVASVAGTCQVNLKFALKTNYPDVHVRYYLIDDKHHKSETKTVTTNHIKLAGGTLTYDVPNGPGEEFGRIHMVGISPNQFISNPVTYRMSCHDGPSGGLTGNQGAGVQQMQIKEFKNQPSKGRIRQNRLLQSLQGVHMGVRSRGLDSLPPPIIPDPEPPALPYFEIQEKPGE